MKMKNEKMKMRMRMKMTITMTMLKRICKDVVFTCIPLNLVHLLNYGVKLIKKVNV